MMYSYTSVPICQSDNFNLVKTPLLGKTPEFTGWPYKHNLRVGVECSKTSVGVELAQKQLRQPEMDKSPFESSHSLRIKITSRFALPITSPPVKPPIVDPPR